MSVLNPNRAHTSNLFCSSPMEANRFYSLKLSIVKKFWVCVHKVVDYLDKNLNVSDELKEKIYKNCELPLDIDESKLGAYHKNEIRKYKYIFAHKTQESPEMKMPYKSALFSDNLKSSKRKTDAAIKFFKSISRE